MRDYTIQLFMVKLVMPYWYGSDIHERNRISNFFVINEIYPNLLSLYIHCRSLSPGRCHMPIIQLKEYQLQQECHTYCQPRTIIYWCLSIIDDHLINHYVSLFTFIYHWYQSLMVVFDVWREKRYRRPHRGAFAASGSALAVRLDLQPATIKDFWRKIVIVTVRMLSDA